MDLFEYQGKEFFAQYGMPVSPGKIAFSVEEAVAAAEEWVCQSWSRPKCTPEVVVRPVV